jgi:hypothetical protein
VSEPAPDEPEPSGGREPFGRSKALIALLTAIALLFGYALHGLYDAFPGLQPDPRRTLRADIAPLYVEPHARLGDYLARAGAPPALERWVQRTAAGLLAPERRTPPHIRCEIARLREDEGYVVYARTTVEGLKNLDVAMGAYLYAASGRRLGAEELQLSSLVQRPLPETQLRSPADHFVAFAFVDLPNPAQNGRLRRFFVRLELRQSGQNGTLLAATNTARFSEFRPPESDGRAC